MWAKTVELISGRGSSWLFRRPGDPGERKIQKKWIVIGGAGGQSWEFTRKEGKVHRRWNRINVHRKTLGL